jgi:hypothetical protein
LVGAAHIAAIDRRKSARRLKLAEVFGAIASM